MVKAVAKGSCIMATDRGNCSQPCGAVTYDIVLDLDGTLVQADICGRSADPNAYIKAGGIPHRLAVGCLELLAVLAQRPDVSFSVFSAGDFRRNKQLVEEFGRRVQQWGINSWDVEVYSRQHMQDRGVKDLSRLGRSNSLSNMLLVDDTPDIVPEGQDRNVLQVVASSIAPSTLPPSERVQSKYSIVRAAGILALSWEQHQADAGASEWLELVQQLQWVQGKEVCVMSHAKQLYERGLVLLQQFNPGLTIEPEVGRSGHQVFPWLDSKGR